MQINERGSRQAIIDHLASQKDLQPDGKTLAEDQRQFEAAKALAVSEINCMPTEFNGAQLIIETSAHAGGRHVSVQVLPLKLRL